MYIHPAFQMSEEEALEHLRREAFGLIVVPAGQSAPMAVHVPFLLRVHPDGKRQIEFHVARNNEIHQHISTDTNGLLVCQGPDAYISPDWYGVPEQVPTWCYTSVHVTGSMRLMPETANLAHVERLSANFENRLAPKQPWSVNSVSDKKRSALLKAIVTITLDIEKFEAQKKLIQHKGETENLGAIAGLRSCESAGAKDIALMMEDHLDQ
jgi:transcriptional regulator